MHKLMTARTNPLPTIRRTLSCYLQGFTMSRKMFLGLIVILASGCSPVSVNDYSAFEPRLVLQDFFSGPLTAHGVVKNRNGLVIRTFNADIQASWTDGIGTLDEYFLFDDGERQRRVWTLIPNGDGSYRAEAGDVVGAGRLQSAGNSLFLEYVLRIPYGESTVDVTVDDRMYLVSQAVLINESSMKKFGFRVGSIDLVILRQAGKPATHQ